MKFKVKLWQMLLLAGLGAYYIYTQQVDKNLVPFLNETVTQLLAEKESLRDVKPQERLLAVSKVMSAWKLEDEQEFDSYNSVAGSGYSIHYDIYDDILRVTINTGYNQTCLAVSRAFLAMHQSSLALRGLSWLQSSSQRMSWNADSNKPIEILEMWGSPEVNPNPSILPTETQMKWACAQSDNVTATFSLK